MDAHLIIAGGGHSGMAVARAEVNLRAMEEPCLFSEPSPAPHAIQGEAPPFPLPSGPQSKTELKSKWGKEKGGIANPRVRC